VAREILRFQNNNKGNAVAVVLLLLGLGCGLVGLITFGSTTSALFFVLTAIFVTGFAIVDAVKSLERTLGNRLNKTAMPAAKTSKTSGASCLRCESPVPAGVEYCEHCR
jgi:hypothetical protein